MAVAAAVAVAVVAAVTDGGGGGGGVTGGDITGGGVTDGGSGGGTTTGSGCSIESGRINADSLPPQPLRTASNKTRMKHIAPAWSFMEITKEIRRYLVSKNLPGQQDNPTHPALNVVPRLNV